MIALIKSLIASSLNIKKLYDSKKMEIKFQ